MCLFNVFRVIQDKVQPHLINLERKENLKLLAVVYTMNYIQKGVSMNW